MSTIVMQAAYQDPIKVVVPFVEVCQAFSAAMIEPLGKTPSNKVLALVLAKTALESGRWGKNGGLWNYNFGNIKAGPTYDGQFTTYKCNEILKGRGLVWFDPKGELTSKTGTLVGQLYEVPPGHPQCRFRAYAGPTDGAYQYIDFVSTGRWTDAFDELCEGDVAGYVHALKLKGYFTADEAEYLRGVQGCFNEFYQKLEGESDVAECEVPDALDIQACLAPQRHNAEATAMAMGMAIESMYDNLNALRLEANRQMSSMD